MICRNLCKVRVLQINEAQKKKKLPLNPSDLKGDLTIAPPRYSGQRYLNISIDFTYCIW